MFEYRNGKLVVDELIIDPAIAATSIVVRIRDSYFKIRNRISNDQIKEGEIDPYKKAVNEGWVRGSQYQQFMQGCIPRGGYQVSLGRAITDEEFSSLCAEYNLGEDEITEPFEDYAGSIFGDEYKKKFLAKQIMLSSGEDTYTVERRLNDMGIQASNNSPGRVNIRIEDNRLGE